MARIFEKNFTLTSPEIPSVNLRNSISAKIFWISVAVGLAVGLVVGTIQIINEARIERNNFEGIAHGVLQAHSVAATSALLNDDTALANDVITGMFANSAVYRAEIKNGSGRIFAQKTLEINPEPTGPIADFIFRHAASDGVELTIADQSEPVGELLIYFDANKIVQGFLSRIWLDILITTIGAFLLAATFGALFYWIFGKPLVDTTAQLQANIDSGELDLVVNIPRHHSNDELGLLLKTFNAVVASRAAADNELQFQKLAIDEHAIVSIADAEGKLTYANDRFIKVSGYTRKELLGNNHRVLRSDWHTPKFFQNLWQTISSGETWQGEIQNTKKNGSSYWVKETIIPEMGSDGIPIRFIFISTDISDIKAKEREIRRFKSTLDLTQDEVYLSYPDIGQFFYVNQAVARKLGYSAKELLKLGPQDINPEVNEEQYRDLVEPLFNGTKKSIDLQTIHRHKNGTDIPVEINMQLIRPKDERPHFVAIVRDITERKSADLQILQFKATLDNIEDPVYMFWPDTLKFFYINQAAINLTGNSAKQFAEMTPADLNPNFDLTAFRNRCKPLVHGTENAITYDTQHLNSEGELVPFELRVQIIEPRGEKPRFVAIARDISKRREIENAKSEFISTVSHELRTPLTSIKGAIGLVTGGATGEIPDDTAKILRLAYDNSVRLENLINDIFDIEKAEAGLLELQIQSIDLAKLIREATEEAKTIGDENGVTFNLSGTQERILVKGDKNRLLQVLAKLLSNAVKFSNAGDEVVVDLSAVGDTVQISVTDFGSGIPKNAQVKIFEKFTQQDSSDQRLKGGTGLGLSIAKAIVEAHGGSISITSDVGKGSTFFFELKISDADAEFAA